MLSLKTFDQNFNATLLTIDCLNSCGQHRRMKGENAVNNGSLDLAKGSSARRSLGA
jgi:hypothetical protein